MGSDPFRTSSRGYQQSCPAFAELLPDGTNLESDADNTISRTDSVGLKSWFSEHVSNNEATNMGAPRPPTPLRRSATTKTEAECCRRQIALENVSRYASRCKEVDNQFLFSSRSSPDLAADLRREGVPEGEGAGQAGFHKDNCGILWHKDTVANQESPQSDVPTCYEACCDARLVFRKLASIFHSALGHGDLGIEDPGFHDPANAVIIFDWDDTLLPTTYILGTIIPSLAEEDRAGVLPESSEYKEQLAAHAHLVSFLLRAARRVARVAIVSNSLSPWVQASAARYLPGVDFEALFEELDLPVYYSRQHLSNIPVTYKVDNWEVNLDRRTGGRIGVDIIREFDGSLAVAKIEEGGLMDQWNQSYPDQAVQPGDRFAEVNGNTESLAAECRKLQELKITVYRAVPDRDPYVEAKRIDMTACLDKFYGRHVKWQQNVLSIGDACTEQQAIKEVLHDNAESSRPQPLCKTVNLIDTPTLEQLSNELRILLVWLSKMVQYPKDFDLFMDELDDLEAELFRA